jgi:hypothetical protein
MLFAPRPNNGVQPRQDPADYAEMMMKRSGGDARAAFYMACKEKGVDPEQFLQQVRSIRDPQTMLQNIFMQDPKAQQLMTLFSLSK